MSENSIPNPENTEKAYSQTLEYLYDRLPVFHHIGSGAYKPGLENTKRLLDKLGNPQNKYKTIHIAGTNGKGSVSHMLAAALQQAGYKTGLYTSPHLVDFGERIRVNGKMIDKQYVIDFTNNHKILFAEIEPSFFEATMAMAFEYFAESGVDVAVVEVGLGGRLDSTNIIQPELSVITNISFDHTGFLGDTLEKIAFEKAGIIKPNTPVVVGEALAETRPVFEQKAKEENAPIYFAEDLVKVGFVGYEGTKMKMKTSLNQEFSIGLIGNYQLKNVATVVLSWQQLQQLGFNIPEKALAEGFENVNEITGFRGRWEVLRQNPKIVADTGHNEAGIQLVVHQLENEKYHTLHVVIGMVNDKDISAVLALLPKNAQYYFTRADIPRALDAGELQQKASTFGLKGEAFNTVKEAVTEAQSNAGNDDLVFIGGSNFVVGEAIALLD